MSADGAELKGRVALVTGGSRGIGRAIALRMASAGAAVAVTGRSLERTATFPGTLLETVAEIEAGGGRAHAIQGDVTDSADRRRMVEEAHAHFGRLDVLVNNAGTADYVTIAEMSPEICDRTVGQYFLAPLELSQHAVPRMREQGEGWILNIGSATALPPPGPPFDPFSRGGGLTLYASLKAALHRFSVGLAAELHADRIAVNCVGPVGAVRTPSVEAAGVIPEGPSDMVEPVEFMAEAALALCSGDPAELTGRVGFSKPILEQLGRAVRSLDGKRLLDEPPAGEG